MRNNNEKVDLSLDNEEFFRQYGRKKTVGMFVLGCKVNQYETEAITGIFEKEGYAVVDFEDKADVYVINTCTVTNLSDRKSRQMIRKAKRNNENAVVVVTGCYAQTAPEEVGKIPGVSIVIGTKERSRIMEYIRQLKEGTQSVNAVGDIMHTRYFEQLNIDCYKERTRAFLKIQEGCSQFCSYCIIPYARGPVRSREPEEVLDEVKRLAEGGFKEVVLTGIHVASYGKDLKTASLPDIIKKVHEIEGIERIRLGSIEPTTITREFVEAAAKLPKLCPHYHISLQSGCDATLKRMNRKYTVKEFRNVVELLRQNITDVSITTDIMVGFPHETEDEFLDTYRFLEEINLMQMHVFKFSPRKGTPAASYGGQVAPEKKDHRSSLLIEMSKKNTISFNSKYLGKTVKVLFEQEIKDRQGIAEGLTPNYMRVLCEGNADLKGEILDVDLLRIEEEHIIGKAVV